VEGEVNQIPNLPKFEWREGMLMRRWAPGFRDHWQRAGRILLADEAYDDVAPDLTDHATQGALIGLLEDMLGCKCWLEYTAPTEADCGYEAEPGGWYLETSEHRKAVSDLPISETREAALKAACMEVLR
jgi:hypothetical protein